MAFALTKLLFYSFVPGSIFCRRTDRITKRRTPRLRLLTIPIRLTPRENDGDIAEPGRCEDQKAFGILFHRLAAALCIDE
jgi:hypothetical protein